MAASPMPDQDQGQSSASAMGGNAPASPEQQQLAAIYQHLKQMSQANPVLSAGLEKAAQGLQEAQSALVSQPQQSQSQNPSY